MLVTLPALLAARLFPHDKACAVVHIGPVVGLPAPFGACLLLQILGRLHDDRCLRQGLQVFSNPFWFPEVSVLRATDYGVLMKTHTRAFSRRG